MTSLRPNDSRVLFMADAFYKELVSTTRAKDVSLYYYRRELKKQKATEEDLKKVSLFYGMHFMEGYLKLKESSNSQLTEEQIQKLVRESIEYAKKQFKDQ